MEGQKALNLLLISAVVMSAIGLTACASSADANGGVIVPASYPLPTMVPTASPTAFPTIPADPSLTAPYFCEEVNSTVIEAVQRGLKDEGSKLSMTDLTVAKWYVALAHNKQIYNTQIGNIIVDSNPNDPFNRVTKGDHVCASPDEAAASLHLGEPIKNGDSGFIPGSNRGVIFAGLSRSSKPQVARNIATRYFAS